MLDGISLVFEDRDQGCKLMEEAYNEMVKLRLEQNKLETNRGYVDKWCR